jgi:hypothetical protein
MATAPPTLAILVVAATISGSVGALAQPANFNAFLLPEMIMIPEGDTARVRFEVDETAIQFNGYRVEIRYRPGIVDFVPPVIEGPLMTGACGSTFPFLAEPDDSTLVYQHAIMCGGAPLNGPGLLSSYAFVGLAEGTSPITIINHPDSMFTDAGVWVNPRHPTLPRQVIVSHASIEVRSATGITPEPVSPPAFNLSQAIPNPSAASTAIPFELGSPGWVTLEILDFCGRRVWAQRELRPAGTHVWHWDGTDARGTPLASGTYLYRLTTARGHAARKLVLVH